MTAYRRGTVIQSPEFGFWLTKTSTDLEMIFGKHIFDCRNKLLKNCISDLC